jgi:hypothetical protein
VSGIHPGLTELGFAEARGPCLLTEKVRDFDFPTPRASHPANTTMELLPAHQPLLEDDTDEDMSDEQVRELLSEAAARMRAKAAGKSTATSDVPFKLPRLKPGHLADTYEKTDGNITRLDHSKLVDPQQQALANGIKKIDDPLAVKKQKKIEVCTTLLDFQDGLGMALYWLVITVVQCTARLVTLTVASHCNTVVDHVVHCHTHHHHLSRP